MTRVEFQAEAAKLAASLTFAPDGCFYIEGPLNQDDDPAFAIIGENGGRDWFFSTVPADDLAHSQSWPDSIEKLTTALAKLAARICRL